MRYVTWSMDDATEQALFALEPLERAGFRGTFYWQTHEASERGLWPLAWYLARRMEIGGHTVTHAHLPQVGKDKAWREVVEGLRILEAKTDAPVTMFAYPYGDFDDATAALVAQAGFIGARTTMRFGDHVQPADSDTARYRLPITLNFWNPSEDANVVPECERVNAAFLHWLESGLQVFHVLTHPYSWPIEMADALGDVLAGWREKLAGVGDVRCVTNGEMVKELYGANR